MTNGTGTTYVGMTNDIERRVRERKEGILHGFTSKYKINHLVHYEEFEYVYDAIAREKQIKKWMDLSKDLFS
jgi:putative endonuclease